MPPQTSSKKHFILPVIAVVILAVLIYLGFRSTNDPIASVPLGDVPAIEWPSEQIRKETITDSTKGYEITAYYPITKSEAITATLRDFVTGQIETFKADTAAAGEMPEGYRALTLDISYEEIKNTSADNYVFLSYSDTGGAHGLSATTTFSFNKTGQQITIEDLFTSGLRGLGVIADVVKQELLKREFADSDWISEGAAPTKENYQNFIVAEEGITVIFDQYQVAPYAAGIQKVLVPTSAFKNIANPELFK